MSEEQVKRPARYSGPNCSGICICGHSWEDHHCSVALNPDYVTDPPENWIPAECEFYGSNESGGLDDKGKDHCWKYRDSLWPDEHN